MSQREIERRLAILQRKIKSTLEGLEKDQLSLNVFASFERDIEGWIEELKVVSWSRGEQLAAEGKLESLAELFRTSFRFKRDVRQ